MSVIFRYRKAGSAVGAVAFSDATFAARGLPASDLISLCKMREIISTFITTAFPREVLHFVAAEVEALLTRSVGF